MKREGNFRFGMKSSMFSRRGISPSSQAGDFVTGYAMDIDRLNRDTFY